MTESTHGRRRALRLAGAGIIGAIATSAIADTARADDGVTLTAGVPTTTVSPVRTVFQGAAGNIGYLFESGTSGGSNATSFPAVVGAWARPSGNPVHGIYAYSAKANGSGIVAEAVASGGIGALGIGSSVGVEGRSTDTGVRGESTGNESVGVYGVGGGTDSAGVLGFASAGTGVSGITGSVDGFGVHGSGNTGGRFHGTGTSTSTGLIAIGTGAGIRVAGTVQIAFFPAGIAPPAQTIAHEVGEMVVDQVGDSWMCVATGTPGTWRKIAGATTAGAFHAIEPARVYDSRRNTSPTPNGKLTTGQNRIVPVRDRRDLQTGVVNALNVVPVGASAITYNVTVTEMAGTGWVYVAPGSSTTVAASTINWDSTTRGALANGSTVAIDAPRSVRLFAGGLPGAETHVIIDVTGFYR